MDDPRLHILTGLLVLRAQGGESEAFAQLAGIWADPLHRRACRLLGDAEAAQEISQEAWLAIARGIARLRDPDRFVPWAMRIVHNKCADAIRARVRERGMQPKAPAPDDHTEPIDTRVIRDAICLLPPKYREVIMLRYLDNCSVESIAVALAIPTSTVKTRLRRAHARLRTTFERNTP
ncbi:MAG: sigma-70 family RNA polymerase sigma factor [Phycisphaerales bacterium]|nr:sigma-70 family RNA polymerase sigma factor [Phycisphaerales bacterium]